MKTTLGPLAVLGVGKVHGLIAVRRGLTSSVRRRYPKQVPSAAQTRVRANWAAVDRVWQNLDDAHHRAWNAYRRWERLYGYNQFMRVNIPRGLAGLPLYLLPENIP